jgi:hypothetical protein
VIRLLLVLLGACSAYEDHVRLVPITPAESEAVDCDKMCAEAGIDSLNYCTVASRVAPRPPALAKKKFLVCSVRTKSNAFAAAQ